MELCKALYELPQPVPIEIIMKIPKTWSLYWIYHDEELVQPATPAIWPLRAVMAKITSMQKSHQPPQQLFIAMMKKWLSNKNRPRHLLQPHQPPQPQLWIIRITEQMAKIKISIFIDLMLIWYSHSVWKLLHKVSFWIFDCDSKNDKFYCGDTCCNWQYWQLWQQWQLWR